jgi:hypothetical protein
MANTSHIVVAQMKENGEDWHFTSFIAQFGIIFILVAWGLKYVFTPKTEQQKFLKALPIPGPKDKWFRWIRATLDSVQRSKELVDEGYQKVSFLLRARKTRECRPSCYAHCYIVLQRKLCLHHAQF